MKQHSIILPEPGLAGVPHLNDLIGDGDMALCHRVDRGEMHTRFPNCTIVSFDNGPLTPSREDLSTLSERLNLSNEVILVRDEDRPWGWDSYISTLGLMGFSSVSMVSQSRKTKVSPPKKPDMEKAKSLLLIACGGIGNVIQATPLLEASLNAGLKTYFCPVSDSGESLAPLFKRALNGLRLVAPETLSTFHTDIRLNIECRAHMFDGEFFQSPYREAMDRHEAEAYARFFKNVTGFTVDPGATVIGGQTVKTPEKLQKRVVLCPGSKPGWDSKRWPHFGELAEQLDAPVILCRETDLDAYEKLDFLKPMQCSNATVVTDASLAEAAAILRSAKGVIANDCGLAHMAAAAGTPTLALFGPSSLAKNQPLRDNAQSLSLCLECQPCQGRTDGPGRLGPGDYSCDLGFCCLEELTVERVMTEALKLFNQTHGTSA